MNELITLGELLVVPILRAAGGWLQNSLKDGEISLPEWKEGGATIIRVGLITLATYYGLNGLGVDVSAIAAGFSAFIMDKLFEAIKDGKKK